MPADKNRKIKVKKKEEALGAALDNSNQPPTQMQKRSVGRPKVGKRSNTDFKQTSVYLRKETLKSAKNKLFDSDEDLSDVLENLLIEWLKN